MRKATALLTLCFYLVSFPCHALAEYVCGQDLDGDGYADGQGETAVCTQVGGAWFCPVGAVPCSAGSSVPVCPPNGTLDPERDICQVAPSWSCPPNYTNAGGRCERAPVCPSGYSYNTSSNSCRQTVNGTWTYSASVRAPGAVYEQRSSSSPRLTLYAPGANPLELVFSSGNGHLTQCPSMKLSMNVPPGGSFASHSYTFYNSSKMGCPSGYSASGTTCIKSVAASCPSGSLDGSKDVCQTNATPSCPSGFTYSGSPIKICEAAVSCPDGSYDPDLDRCQGEDICPLGSQYACIGEPGHSRCSPNTCFDRSAPGNEIAELPPEDKMYQDDGPVDEEGNCLGQIYIFSGKATRCRPPGVTVGYLNDCCDNDAQALSDTKTGVSMARMASAIKKTYEVAQVAYYSYQISTGAMTATAGAGGSVTVATLATGAATTLEGATASGVLAAQGAVAGGATASGAVTSGLTAYAGALLNPVSIAIAVAVMVAMEILMGGGCDQKDIETALLNDSDYCHYLGRVCEKKWPAVGCVQRAKRYCCFNSKMARIIHEQGRPQLKSFGPDGGWGDKKNPDCRGFTPEEFQQLDFAKIDLSEYFGDITRDMTEKVRDAQIKVQQGVQEHYRQIR